MWLRRHPKVCRIESLNLRRIIRKVISIRVAIDAIEMHDLIVELIFGRLVCSGRSEHMQPLTGEDICRLRFFSVRAFLSDFNLNRN
jgi:hypothetical protein